MESRLSLCMEKRLSDQALAFRARSGAAHLAIAVPQGAARNRTLAFSRSRVDHPPFDDPPSDSKGPRREAMQRSCTPRSARMRNMAGEPAGDQPRALFEGPWKTLISPAGHGQGNAETMPGGS